MGGRPPKVSDEEVVKAIVLHPEPVVSAMDIHEDLDMSPRGMGKRLNAMVDDNYLNSKTVGSSAKVYWLSDKGRQLLDQTDLTE